MPNIIAKYKESGSNTSRAIINLYNVSVSTSFNLYNPLAASIMNRVKLYEKKMTKSVIAAAIKFEFISRYM